MCDVGQPIGYIPAKMRTAPPKQYADILYMTPVLMNKEKFADSNPLNYAIIEENAANITVKAP